MEQHIPFSLIICEPFSRILEILLYIAVFACYLIKAMGDVLYHISREIICKFIAGYSSFYGGFVYNIKIYCVLNEVSSRNVWVLKRSTDLRLNR